ncbi:MULTISPECIES: type I restriction-modification system subunit M [Methanobacterium]|uniref:site-specific DNA-methyltransferase (adenine-specific) n=1 Tax=Methanobacterium veterum TaxID=408577 RepID=A0A9E5DI66_9EURY|nr:MULTISPECIES: class I SAM-dependent DNA methyltransferase [Methanobacterium]MCZ3366536.1 class I SAM-dependent DNA methyltransferase [Methanobacterium veterum]MCZ3371755.1 class I SAM-dependent DNA methyltransferase [Methanobacterium veterum]
MANTIKLPKWLEDRHTILWNTFKDNEFKMEDAINALEGTESGKKGVDKKGVTVVMSELRKAGWLNVSFDKEDSRKRIYNLKSKEQIIKEQLTLKEGKLTRSDIIAILKKAADLIRTRVDYKFILVLLFLKEISDKWDTEYERAYKEAIEDGLNEKEAAIEASEPSFHDFDLPEEYKWDNLRKDVENLPENFSNALKTIAEKNTQLKGVIDSFDFVEFTQSRENAEILRQLVELFSEKKLHNVDPDILGDAYEWILSYFAPQKAKEGEVYTPREVIKLLVEILDPKPEESVYDPASASNGMLIISHKHVKDNYGKDAADKLFLYGQEVNQKTLALGTMNLYIHDIKNANVAQGDTLLYPKFKEGNGVKQFDVVIANPPWNLDGFPEDTLKKGDFWKQRYSYGFVGKQSADWAWIQHMIASAKDNTGRIGIVIDNGALFRGGKEKKIRTSIIKEDLIDCVILLPEKLFYNTGAPGAIIVLNESKSEVRKGKVLFINASQEFEQHPEVRKLKILGEDNIKKVAEIYREFNDNDGFAKVITLEEIKENDYNLNVSLYAFPEDKIEDIDIAKEWEDLKKLELELQAIDEKVRGYLEEVL